MKQLLSIFATFLLMSTTQAQTKTAAMVKDWERAKAYTLEYLNAMPESGYALKPTKEMRSFAGQFLHLSDGIYGFVATAAAVTSPVGIGELEKSNDENKASVTRKVMAAYDFAIQAIQNYPDAKLAATVKLFGRFEMSGEQALQKCFEHQTHHRGQTTVYLRLAGATPPAEKLF